MGWIVHQPGTLKRITESAFDSYIRSQTWPNVFMTGDAHSTPMFQWTGICQSVKHFFLHALNAGRLYAFVETRPAEVTAELVPDFLAPLFGQQRIIGWELPLFEQLRPSIEGSLQLAGDLTGKKLHAIEGLLNDFGKLIENVPEILARNKALDLPIFEQLNKITECLATYERNKADGAFIEQLQEAAIGYHRACMVLRCDPDYHRAVGTMIQRQMLTARPDSIHLISCGDGHLTCADPLYQFIPLVEVRNSLGWIDAAH